MTHINKPRYVEGIGFRCETEHTMKRWARWKDARKPGTYFITLSVAAHQNLLGVADGDAMVVWQWLREHPEVKEACSVDALYMKHAVVGERRLPFCRSLALPSMAEDGAKASLLEAKRRLRVVLPLEALQQPGGPEIVLTALGKEVERCWQEISVRQPAIETLMLCVMPNHLHAVICVNRDMEKTVGDAIAGFMRGTTMALRRMLATGEATWSHEAVVSELRRDEEERERVLAAGLKVIMIQAEAIPSDKWHPGKTFRGCCGRGQLLILAPWQPEQKEYHDQYGNMIPSSTDYAHFHDLNGVAAEICRYGDYCSIVPEARQ